MQSIILHLDMNSFFASCEQQDNPKWRGRVLGVCEHLGGIIIAASIEAKKWGIKTGTAVWEAKKIYPKIILTRTRPEAYRLYNRKLVKSVSDYTGDVEVYSIDEVFLDITRVCNISRLVIASEAKQSNLKLPRRFAPRNDSIVNPFEEAVKIAKEIKCRMKREMGEYLLCSIGIAENKLLAKIASDMQKPDGLVVITENQNEKIKMQNLGVFSFTKNELYNRLALTDVPGIGQRMENRLFSLGIKTLLDLKNYPKSKLVALFGVPGHHLYNLGQLQGSFHPEIENDKEIKSMGHMYTLPEEFRKAEYFAPVLYKLCEMVGGRLRRKNLSGQVLSVHAHGIQGNCFSKIKRLTLSLWDGREIFLQAMEIFESFKMLPLACKLVGVTVGELGPMDNQQSLFGDKERNRRLAAALDGINAKYGDFTVCRAAALKAGKVFRDSIGFGRIREMGK